MSVTPNWRQGFPCTRRLAWSGQVGMLILTSLLSPPVCGAHEASTEPEVMAQLGPPLLPMGRPVGWSRPILSPDSGRYSRMVKAMPRTDAEDGAARRSRSFRRRAACVSAAVAVAGGVVARWSKRKADRAYDRYLHSAGLRRQNEAFDRSRRYDRITGGAFVAMEVGIVLAAYFTFY